MSAPNNWRCPECGHESMLTVSKATVDVSIVMACSGCGTLMDRLDPLGAIEAGARRGARPIKFADLHHKGDPAKVAEHKAAMEADLDALDEGCGQGRADTE